MLSRQFVKNNTNRISFWHTCHRHLSQKKNPIYLFWDKCLWYLFFFKKSRFKEIIVENISVGFFFFSRDIFTNRFKYSDFIALQKIIIYTSCGKGIFSRHSYEAFSFSVRIISLALNLHILKKNSWILY